MSIRSIFLATLLAFYTTNLYSDTYLLFIKSLKNNDSEVVKELLLKGVDPNTPDENGQPGLMYALSNRSFSVAEILMKHKDIKINAINASDENALMLAALNGSAVWVQKLIEHGAKVHKVGWSPLHYAATSTNTDCLKILLAHGAKINALSPNGTTPLMMAAQYGTEESVMLLLKEGAKLDLQNQQLLKAHNFAKLAGRLDLEKRLIQIESALNE